MPDDPIIQYGAYGSAENPVSSVEATALRAALDRAERIRKEEKDARENPAVSPLRQLSMMGGQVDAPVMRITPRDPRNRTDGQQVILEFAIAGGRFCEFILDGAQGRFTDI